MGSTPSKISASRISSILGISPYIVDTWKSMIEEEYPGFLNENLYPPIEREISPAMEAGIIFEDPIRDYLGIDNREKFYQNGLFTCHIDGTDQENVNTEIKTTSSFAFRELYGDPLSEEIPASYYVQVQQQMWLSEKDITRLVVLVFPDSQDNMKKNGLLDMMKDHPRSAIDAVRGLDILGMLKTYVIRRNEITIEKIKHDGTLFWEKHIIGKKKPNVESFSELKKILLPVSGECLATSDIIQTAKLYQYMSTEVNRVKKEHDKLKTKLVSFMQENCNESKSGKMIIKDNRGFNVASYGNRMWVRKEKV